MQSHQTPGRLWIHPEKVTPGRLFGRRGGRDQYEETQAWRVDILGPYSSVEIGTRLEGLRGATRIPPTQQSAAA